MGKKSVAKFLVWFGMILLATPQMALTDGVDCGVARSAMITAARIRQLSVKREVPCTIENRDQVEKFLRSAVQNKIPAEKMRADEIIAKALGFIPEDFDYKTELVKLYLSQLGGYYDPERKRYVMAGWLPELMQPTVAVHELTHALQDQHFNLEAFIDDIHFTSDKLLARAALVEGDATAVMLDYQRGLLSQEPIAQIENVDSFVLQTVLSMALSTTNNPVPEALKAALLFPYASGLRFVHHLLRTGGYAAVSEAFAHPPETTEEVLHPEKFGRAKSESRTISDENIKQEIGDVAIRYSDTLGEFSISALLSGAQTRRDLASSAAAGWAGDRAVLFETTEKKEAVLWKSCWDTPLDAQEFFSAYREFLTSQGSSVEQSQENVLRVTVDSRTITLALNGDTVVVKVIF